MTSPIKEYRYRKGLFLEDLGRKLNVDKSTVCRWENGKTKIPVDKLADVERVTKISRKRLRPDIFGPFT